MTTSPTTAAATVVLYDADHREVSRWGFMVTDRATACAAAVSAALRNGLPRLPILDDDHRFPPCYVDRQRTAYARVIYHHRQPTTPTARHVPAIDHQARASGEREG